MTNIFAKAAIAAVLSLGTLAAIPAAASANDFGVYFGVGGPGYHHRHHNDRRDYRVFHGERHAGRCSDGRAIWKAERTGLHRAYVTRRGPGRVVVEGRRHHRFDRMVFANSRGCPIIRY